MVPRACNTRFLKIEFDLAEIFDSACDEISSAYAPAQHAMKFVPRMLSVCPASQVKRRPSAARLLPAPTQMALCLRLACYDF
jgi:hypothetical protein